MGDNRNPDVDGWFEGYDHPQKPLVQAVRAVILDADPRVTEAVRTASSRVRETPPGSRGSPTSRTRPPARIVSARPGRVAAGSRR